MEEFFFQIDVPSVRAIVLADASTKVKIIFQNSYVLCGSEGMHYCSFPVCACGCLKVSVEKILGTNVFFLRLW